MKRRAPRVLIDMTREPDEVVRASYLDWYAHRCPKVNRRGDRCILKTTEHQGLRHDYGHWIRHEAHVI